jgi:hypothetical protein
MRKIQDILVGFLIDRKDILKCTSRCEFQTVKQLTSKIKG